MPFRPDRERAVVQEVLRLHALVRAGRDSLSFTVRISSTSAATAQVADAIPRARPQVARLTLATLDEGPVNRCRL